MVNIENVIKDMNPYPKMVQCIMYRETTILHLLNITGYVQITGNCIKQIAAFEGEMQISFDPNSNVLQNIQFTFCKHEFSGFIVALSGACHDRDFL